MNVVSQTAKRCLGIRCLIKIYVRFSLKVSPYTDNGMGSAGVNCNQRTSLGQYLILTCGKLLGPRPPDFVSRPLPSKQKSGREGKRPCYTLYVWISSLSIFSKQCWTTRDVTPSSDSSVKVLPKNIRYNDVWDGNVDCVTNIVMCALNVSMPHYTI